MARKQKTIHYLYKTTCLITGRWYIGMHSTNNLNDGYLGSGDRLRRSVRKYGKNNHDKEILEFLPTREELSKREREIVTKELILDVKCMNLTIGGEAGGFISEKHMIKCSKAGNKAFKEKLKNNLEFRDSFSKKRSESSKKAISEGKIIPINEKYSWVGKNHSQESKNKMSETSKGTGISESNSQYGTCWITKEGTNKKIKKEDLNTYLNEGWFNGRFTNIKGELVKNSKLTNDDVLKIKELIYKNELSQSKIGKMFNVKQETISKIKRGLTHKNT
jgi:predicted XRE-type DNA-binding protein